MCSACHYPLLQKDKHIPSLEATINKQVQATAPADIISLSNIYPRHNNINQVEYSLEELEEQQQFVSSDASMYQRVICTQETIINQYALKTLSAFPV